MTPAKWQTETSWDQLVTSEAPNGTRATKFAVGADPDDPGAPVVFRVVFPPGATVPTHLHDTDYCEIVLEGSQQVGRTWHHAGDIRIAQAGTAYGPLLAGPEGCTVLVVFRDGRWPAVPVGRDGGEDPYTDVFRRELTGGGASPSPTRDRIGDGTVGSEGPAERSGDEQHLRAAWMGGPEDEKTPTRRQDPHE